MADSSSPFTKLPADILSPLIDHLHGNSQALTNLSRTCKGLHASCTPSLLSVVDLSSHNLGRQPEHESQDLASMFTVVKADFHNKYRPRNQLVARRRAFIGLMIERPDLASYVKTFTWTLIWQDFGEESITDIDRLTWTVFSLLKNVINLDLASLHDIWDEPYIGLNPTELFPSVAHLRLVGWIHRGLVEVIVGTLDATKLRSLDLDHLEDEGVMPSGTPMSVDITQDYAPCEINAGEDIEFDNETVQRQMKGGICVFPGPM